MIIIVFGVSGSGKTTIGKLLAEQLRLPFYDADDFHPEANVKKMSDGFPLDDVDRAPWLLALAKYIAEWSQGKGAVLACSALKESYRTLLSSQYRKDIIWVYLSGSKAVIKKRMETRADHFMPSKLLDSQFEALEVPTYGIHVDISKDKTTIVETVLSKL